MLEMCEQPLTDQLFDINASEMDILIKGENSHGTFHCDCMYIFT